jgi:RNA polymerase sigma factor (TIGR02999 family)
VSQASDQITEMLGALRAGDRGAFDRVVPLVCRELRRIARGRLATHPSGTLTTTALVNEAYLELVEQAGGDARDRAQFFVIASIAMRQILVDLAMRKQREMGGGTRQQVPFQKEELPVDDQAESFLELDDALTKLAALDARLARVVEYRFFGGLTEDETAEVLGVTTRTVRQDWVKARAVLLRLISAPD